MMKERAGAEHTAVRFSIDAAGGVTDVNVHEQALQTLRNPLPRREILRAIRRMP